jgi:hypothetical protein
MAGGLSLAVGDISAANEYPPAPQEGTMTLRNSRPLLLVLALLLLTACQQSSGVLFYDRFGNPDSGWGAKAGRPTTGATRRGSTS